MPLDLIKPTILIVDDDTASSTVLSVVLADHYNIIVANDGKQAIESVTASRPDLVLLDIMMPGMDGYEVLAAFKTLYAENPFPVIFLTGTNDENAELRALADGAVDFISKPYKSEVVIARVKLQLELNIKTTKLQDANKKLDELARVDPLTQIANRRHFTEVAYAEVERAKRSNGNLSFIMLDIDDFKMINDNHGHLAGDIVLKAFASASKASIRAGDFLARIGGEEFVCLLPNSNLLEAVETAERLRSVVEALPIVINKQLTVKITVSGGVVQFQPNEQVEETLQRADTAMFEAKRLGKNQICSLIVEGSLTS